MMRILLAAACACLAAPDRPASAAEPRQAPPADAPATEGDPVLTFVWVSDMHLDASRRERVGRALRAAGEAFAPDFFLFTGDNNAVPVPPAKGAPPEPLPVRRQRYLKAFLADRLRVPAVVVPGDNWPGGFDRVFGPAQHSFDAAGFHVIVLAPDRTCHAQGAEGLSVFDAGTWAWLRKDLEANRGKPCILAIHEPVYPPAFLDAPALRELLRGHPNVLAVLQGHLHADLELRADGRAWFVAPALGPGALPAIKRVRIYPTAIRLQTFATDSETGRPASVGRPQTVSVPPALRKGLVRPAEGFAMGNRSCVPAHPHVDDPSLAARRGELSRNLPAALESLLRLRPRR